LHFKNEIPLQNNKTSGNWSFLIEAGSYTIEGYIKVGKSNCKLKNYPLLLFSV